MDFFEYFEQAANYAETSGSGLVWFGILFVLAATGVGFPSPEDIPLMLAGFLTYRSGAFGMHEGAPPAGFDFWAFFLVTTCCAVANVVGDIGAYWAGRKWGLPIRDRVKLVRRIISDEALLKVEGWFHKFGNATVFFGRLVAGVRLVTFFTAGTAKMEFKKFVMWDFIGCYVSIPVWLAIGATGASYYSQQDKWDSFKLWVGDVGVYIFFAAVGLALLVFLYFRFVRKPKEGELSLIEAGKIHEHEVELAQIEKEHKKEVKRSGRRVVVSAPDQSTP